MTSWRLVACLFLIRPTWAHLIQKLEATNQLTVVMLTVISLCGVVLTLFFICFNWRSRVRSLCQEDWPVESSSKEASVRLSCNTASGWTMGGFENWFAKHRNRLSKSTSTSSSTSGCSPLVTPVDDVLTTATAWQDSNQSSSTSTDARPGQIARGTPNCLCPSKVVTHFTYKSTIDVFSSQSSPCKPPSSLTSTKSDRWNSFASWPGKISGYLRKIRAHLLYAGRKDEEALILHGTRVYSHAISSIESQLTLERSPCLGSHPAKRGTLHPPRINVHTNLVIPHQDAIRNFDPASVSDLCDGGMLNQPQVSRCSSTGDLIDPIYSRIIPYSHDHLTVASDDDSVVVLNNWSSSSAWQQSDGNSSLASNDLERYPSTHIYYELTSRVDRGNHHHHNKNNNDNDNNNPVTSELLPWQLSDRMAHADRAFLESMLGLVTIDADTTNNQGQQPPQLPARDYGKSTVDLVNELRKQLGTGGFGKPLAPDGSRRLEKEEVEGEEAEDQSCPSIERWTTLLSRLQPFSVPSAPSFSNSIDRWRSELFTTRVSNENRTGLPQRSLFDTSSLHSSYDSLNKSWLASDPNLECQNDDYPAVNYQGGSQLTGLGSVQQDLVDRLSSMRHIDSDVDILQEAHESNYAHSPRRPQNPLLNHVYVPFRGSTHTPALSESLSRSQAGCGLFKFGSETTQRQVMSPLMERSIEDEEARRMFVNVC